MSGGTFGNNGIDVPATFVENRSQPILDKPSDYKFAVSGFSIPADIIPLFRVDNDNVNNRFTITMIVAFNGDTNNLIYYSDYLYSNLSATHNKFFIYNINGFIYELNNCLLRVFDGMINLYNSKVVYPQPTWLEESEYLPQKPVFFDYDPNTNLFNCYGPIQMSTNDPLDVGYFFNAVTFSDNLSNLFLGLNFQNVYISSNFYNRSSYKNLVFYQKPENSNVIVFTNPGSSNTQYIINTQAYSSIENWYNYKKLVIASNTIGTRKQAVGFQKDLYTINQNNTQNGVNNNNITKNIISDYDLIINYGISNNPATRLIYSSNEYRWIDIFDDRPLYQIDCQLYLINQNNEFLPLYMTSGDSFNVKFIFAKKVF